MSRIVRSPVIAQRSPFRTTAVLLNERVGKFAASRKSAERRWLSRGSMPVSIVAAWMTTATDDAVGLASSNSIVPVTPLKMPRVFVIIMCLAVKLTVVWAVSSCQVLIAVSLLPVVRSPLRPAVCS